jgi:glucose dehydrogenase/cytochrome c5
MHDRRVRLALLAGAALVVATVAVVGFAGASGSGAGTTQVFRDLGKSNLALAPKVTTKAGVVGAGTNWLTHGGDLGQSQYSRLTQINNANVGKLELAWSSTYAGTLVNALESEPLEYNGVMYFVDGGGNLVAADASTGKVIWRWTAFSGQLPGLGKPIRGVAIGDGNVYMTTTQGVVVAIYAATGTLNWQTSISLTGPTALEGEPAPVYYKGKLFVGVAGFETGRGHVDALDAETGKLLWRTFVIGGPADDPKTGGGGVWTTVSLDPKLGLVYAVTGNDGAQYAGLFPGQPPDALGDHKWTSSIVAMDMDTGTIKWGFQGVHHDQWDYDCPQPPVLYSVRMKGVLKNGVTFQCKAGYLFLLDRATGKPLVPIKEAPVPQAPGGSNPDPATMAANPNASVTQPVSAGDRISPGCATPEMLPNPAPDGSQYTYSCVYSLRGAGHYIAFTPAYNGGADWQPAALDPKTGYFYQCAVAGAAIAFKAGNPAFAGKYSAPPVGWSGTVAAVNLADNKIVWLNKWFNGQTCFSGVLATAGGLVFTSDNMSNGPSNVYAFDSKTGKQLWTYHTNQPIASPPMTYSYKGHQYVAVFAGGQTTANGGIPAPFERKDTMYVFALPGSEITGKSAPGTTKPGSPIPTDDHGAGATYPTGKSLFVSNCGTCHTLHVAGTTSTAGPTLDVAAGFGLQTIIDTVTKGVPGRMPPFGNMFSSDQIRQIALYLVTATATG